MTSKKPRTALAKLLDSMREMDQPQGSAVAIPTIREPQSSISLVDSSSMWNDLSDLETTPEPEVCIKYLDPNDCQPWQFADRPEDEMGDIDELSLSLKNVGQQEPILVRPKVDSSVIRYEIIFGNRRWRAAKLAKIKLFAIVKQVSDQDAALFQMEENESRKDLSDLARAKSYKAQLDAGIFPSESELSKKLSLSRKTLNDIMSFIRIPEELAIAIPNFKHISRAMAVKLAVLAKDKAVLKKLISLAPKIGMKTINPHNVVNHLNSTKVTQKSMVKHEVIKNDKGNILFSVSIKENEQTLIKISAKYSHHSKIDKLKRIIHDYLAQSND